MYLEYSLQVFLQRFTNPGTNYTLNCQRSVEKKPLEEKIAFNVQDVERYFF